jgi:hypothetical protein
MKREIGAKNEKLTGRYGRTMEKPRKRPCIRSAISVMILVATHPVISITYISQDK